MVITAHRFMPTDRAFACASLALVVALASDPAFAQSTTMLPASPTVQSGTANGAPTTAPVVAVQTQRASRYRRPLPVVMFRGTPPRPGSAPETGPEPAIEFVGSPPAPAPASVLAPASASLPAPSRPYSIVNQAQRDASTLGWNASSLEPVIAPPMVSGDQILRAGQSQALPNQTNRPRYRGPMRRILEDTGRGIVRGIPEAVADALPWVDRDATLEPFDAVLSRAADDLSRAAQGDPAWALPAQNEVRALVRRLDTLSAPPAVQSSNENVRPLSGVTSVDDRPFRPRPIWPGATGRPEIQVRPVTLITSSGQQDGPSALGVAASYVPAIEDDDGNPVPVIAPPRLRTGARGTPSPRRAARSR